MTYVLGKLGARSLSHLNGWFSSPLPHSLSINLWCQVQILPLNQLEDVRTRVSQQLVCTSAQVCITELYRQSCIDSCIDRSLVCGCRWSSHQAIYPLHRLLSDIMPKYILPAMYCLCSCDVVWFGLVLHRRTGWPTQNRVWRVRISSPPSLIVFYMCHLSTAQPQIIDIIELSLQGRFPVLPSPSNYLPSQMVLKLDGGGWDFPFKLNNPTVFWWLLLCLQNLFLMLMFAHTTFFLQHMHTHI